MWRSFTLTIISCLPTHHELEVPIVALLFLSDGRGLVVDLEWVAIFASRCIVAASVSTCRVHEHGARHQHPHSCPVRPGLRHQGPSRVVSTHTDLCLKCAAPEVKACACSDPNSSACTAKNDVIWCARMLAMNLDFSAFRCCCADCDRGTSRRESQLFSLYLCFPASSHGTLSVRIPGSTAMGCRYIEITKRRGRSSRFVKTGGATTSTVIKFSHSV